MYIHVHVLYTCTVHLCTVHLYVHVDQAKSLDLINIHVHVHVCFVLKKSSKQVLKHLKGFT